MIRATIPESSAKLLVLAGRSEPVAVWLETQRGDAMLVITDATGQSQRIPATDRWLTIMRSVRDEVKRADVSLLLIPGATEIPVCIVADAVADLTAILNPPAPADPTDPTDAGDAAKLTATSTWQATELPGITLNAEAIYGGRVPRGVTVIGIGVDEHDRLVVRDGPDSPGAPALERGFQQRVIEPLLNQAAALGGNALLVSVRTGQVYATTYDAMQVAVAKRSIPVRSIPVVQRVIAYNPEWLQRLASEAQSWATSRNDLVRRVVAAALNVLLWFGVYAVAVLWHQFGVLPLESALRANLPGLVTVAGGATATISVGGVLALTVLSLLCWFLSLAEFVSVMFLRISWVRRALAGMLLIDIGLTSLFYHQTVFAAVIPLDADWLGLAVSWMGALIGAVMLGVIGAIVLEGTFVTLLVLAIATTPALVWATGSLLEGTGLLVLRLYYGFRAGLVRLDMARADLRSALPNHPVIVVMATAPAATPARARVGVAMVAGAVMLGVLAVGAWLILG